MRQLDIYVVGFDKSTDQVLVGLNQQFGLPRDAAQRFVNSIPRVARHRADPTEARAYEQALRAIGAIVEVRVTESAAPQRDAALPSLPTPASSTSAAPQYDSSAKLAARIPRAPAVPAEAWHKPGPGAADEFGNLLNDSEDLVIKPAALSQAQRTYKEQPEVQFIMSSGFGKQQLGTARTPVALSPDEAFEQNVATQPRSSQAGNPSPRVWLGLVVLVALALSIWQLTR